RGVPQGPIGHCWMVTTVESKAGMQFTASHSGRCLSPGNLRDNKASNAGPPGCRFQISFKNRSLSPGLRRLVLIDAMDDSEGIKSRVGKLKFFQIWSVF